MVKRIINTPMVQYNEYDPNDPSDVVESMADWLDNMTVWKIRNVVHELDMYGCLNDFGKKVALRFDKKLGGMKYVTRHKKNK
jgi:hypothetical protein